MNAGFGKGIVFCILAVSWLLCGASDVLAGTSHSGYIINDETWSKSMSPHVIAASLTVTSNAIVTIEAGSQVVIQSYHMWIMENAAVVIGPGVIVDYSGNRNIIIQRDGQILAQGTADDPIQLRGNSSGMGAIDITSLRVSEFHYAHFRNMNTIAVRKTDTVEQGNPLFDHCLFKGFANIPLYLEYTSARVFNSIFFDNSSWAVKWYSQSSDERTPTLWYNVFDQNGLYVSPNASQSLAYRDFFRFNRVCGGAGVQLDGRNYKLSNVDIRDCDLLGCSNSVSILTGNSLNTARLENLRIVNCSLSALTNVGIGSIVGTITLTNNWWGTTNEEKIANQLFNAFYDQPKIDVSNALPCAVSNLFPQADVDWSDNNNATGPEDVELVKQHVAGMTNLTSAQQARADVDRDNDVDVRDALMIGSYVNGLIWKLPDPQL